MTYNLQFDGPQHQSLLSSTLQAWAAQDQDIFLVSAEGHRIDTSQRLLTLSSPSLHSLFSPSSSLPGLSLSCSSSSLSSLLSLITTGEARCRSKEEMQEVEEAARCLGVNLNLGEGEDKIETPYNLSLPNPQVDDNPPLPIQSKSQSSFSKTSFLVLDSKCLEKSEITTVSVKLEGHIDDVYMKEVKNKADNTFVKRFSCTICHKSLKDEHTWNNHKCQEGKIYNVKCQYCDQTYLTKKKLANHKFVKHRHLKQERIVEPPFCSVCEKVFCNTKYLRKHQRKAHQDITKEGEVSCGYCFGFYKEAFLSYHISLKHLKDKSEQNLTKNKVYDIHKKEAARKMTRSTCPMCYKRLREEVALKNHRCRAGKIYNVICKYCDETFSSQKMMSGHKSMKHRNLKEDKIIVPPLCSVCEKVFCNKKYLRQHQRKAHQEIVKEGEVSCQYCFGFYKEAFLFNHINSKHQDQFIKESTMK